MASTSCKRIVPIGRGKIAEHDTIRRIVGRLAYRADMRDALRGELGAERTTDEAVGTRYQHPAWCGGVQIHFQPCLLKKRAPLRRKYATCRNPLRAARPP